MGAPVYELGESERDQVFDMAPFLSLAIGYHYAHGDEIYFSPKVYLIEDVRFAH